MAPPMFDEDAEWEAMDNMADFARDPARSKKRPLEQAAPPPSKRTRQDSRIERVLSPPTVKTEVKSEESTSAPGPSVYSGPNATKTVAIPQWYKALSKSKTRNKVNATADVKLSSLKDCITNAVRSGPCAQKVKNDQLLNAIHDAMFLEVTPQLLRDNRLLDKEGLQAVFCGPPQELEKYPDYLQSDADELWHKWDLRVFSTDLMHGIRFDNKSAPAIKDNYLSRRDGGVYGDNDLVNGQWWPAQLCLVRDGAHKSSQGGIAGRNGEGAWSVLLGAGLSESGERYPDYDEGDTVDYCGTDGKDGAVSEYTQRMLETYALKESVRLIRSSKYAHSRYRPKEGFRYDGLYRIVSYEILDRGKQRHRFKLVRNENQPPIRWEGAGIRPTKQELGAWKKLHKEKQYIVNAL